MDALSVVGGALLAATFQWLFAKLDSTQLLSFAKQNQVGLELKKWRNLLLKIQAVLEEAETKQITDPLVKIWVSEVRVLAFDMEDILDEFPLLFDEAQTNNSSNMSCAWFAGTRRSHSMPDYGIRSKIKDVTDRLQCISLEINGLGLNLTKIAVGDMSKSCRLQEKRLTTSLIGDHVCGRETEKEDILQWLLKGDENGVSVMPIVGMGGMGKTTLAQLVYNDESVANHFAIKAWVCVSEQFDLMMVTRIILEKVLSNSYECSSDLDSLQVRLKEELSGKKFLFVLDDVWSESYHQWDLLRRPFKAGAPGSKIIVTTRHCKVALMVGNVAAYHLHALPYDDCLSLFAQHAFGRRDFSAHLNVEEIGQGIVRRCKGLPLAVKTLGGLLHGKRTCDEWNDILTSKLWDLPNEGNDILPALRLSYHHLPSCLKQCFAYCAIFPKGYEFDKDELVFLWMAEGLLLQQPKGMEQMEDLGHKYILDLLSRSFFERASNKESRCYKLCRLPATIGNLMDLRHLDITHTKALNEMPSGIGKLRNLLTLPKFVVGEVDGLRLGELNGLSHLRDQLSILQLHNVLDIQDARHANLNEKKGLQELKLEWSCDFHHSRNETREMEVLNWLKPHQNLQKLTIKFYGAKEFPSWVGDPLFSKVTHLEINHCPRITSLPSLGQLLSLKTLVVKGMVAVKTVGFEFYGCGSSSIEAFPSLKILRFEDMLVWEEWSSSLVGIEHRRVRQFKRLHELQIYNCPKLVSKLPTNLPSLIKLEICKCPQLTYSFVSLPSLRNLNLEECNEMIFRGMVHLKCLRTLEITNISHLACLPTTFKQDMIALEDVRIEECTELTSLWEDRSNTDNLVCLNRIVIKKCPMFDPLAREAHQLVPSHNLEALELLDCNNLRRLPNELFNISCLRILRIIGCKELKSLDGIMKIDSGNNGNIMHLEKLEIIHCPSLKYFPSGKLSPTLKKLVIKDCELLQALPQGIMSNGDDDDDGILHLEEVTVGNCPSLKSFPRGRFPPSLKTLLIEDCELLQALPEGLMCDNDKTLHLECLRVQGLPSLMFFPNGQLPKTLKSLVVFNCRRLDSFPDRMLQHSKALETIEISHCTNLKALPLDCFNSLTRLSRLVISGCHGLESFPESQLLMPNLKFLRINRCKNLKSLPQAMYNLKSLKELKIKSCPNILAIPDGGLPLNLSLLFIDCENLKQPMSEWGLDRLINLHHLWIHWICPPENVLPTSLTELYIRNVADLKSLPQKLLKNLSSLQVLDISRCYQLQTLPKEGLPPSLGSLRIDECPVLQHWCLENKDSRRLIAHIPCLWIGCTLWLLLENITLAACLIHATQSGSEVSDGRQLNNVCEPTIGNGITAGNDY
ncbi:Putative disease resistance RGA1 [Gossypium arboreum]|uniref:Putative disease resistance RGA1 n=1 Tax=Gossypium arboreum TaxID=29729 RepID=A0A0B0P157_GOSAR|nr:Putative disease resistance RGA1 [Gossypium arboreum]